MPLHRALQLNTAALAVLGAVFIGLGHQSALIPVLLASAAVAGFVLTDVLGWLRLNRLVANLIAVAAVVWSLRDFFYMASSGQLLAIAHMLLYLQVVLLFQEKNERVYWQLIVLSLLEVVVAAALDLGPQFGLLLGVYIVLALTALLLLSVYRELTREGETSPVALRPAPHPRAPWQTLLAPPTVLPQIVPEEEAGRSLPARLVVGHVALLTAATLLFTAVFFYATPRERETPWHGTRSRGATSGFMPEVLLPEAGRIHPSPQVVMRVALTRLRTRQPVELVQEPYFHASVLTDYSVEEGASRWTAPPRRSGGPPPALRTTSPSMVRQDVVLESVNPRALPAIMPAREIYGTPSHMGFQPTLMRLSIRADQDGPPLARQFRYTLGTPSIQNGRQLPAIPHPNSALTEFDQERLAAELGALSTFDADRFPQLAETAARVLEAQDLASGSLFAKAQALERHFRAPDLYHYSLNLNFQRDRSLDPIEDFVANHRTGHCEYFASALAMMLRSQGIPARLVVGFKGGEFNSLGRYYVVQQRHAHAWVEAWMPPGEVMEWDIAEAPSAGGAWYRLDPTPPEIAVVAAGDDEGLAKRVSQAFDYVELLWRDYVLSLNAARQEDAVYDPVAAQAAALPNWVGGRTLRRWMRSVAQLVGVSLPRRGVGEPRPAFESWLALLVAGLVLCGLIAIQTIRLAAGKLLGWIRPRLARNQAASHPPVFYLRLERLLGGLPLKRTHGQTPRELATLAEKQLERANGESGMAGLPAEIVAAYYRVRFGGERLDRSEVEQIEQALAVLAPAVQQARLPRH